MKMWTEETWQGATVLGKQLLWLQSIQGKMWVLGLNVRYVSYDTEVARKPQNVQDTAVFPVFSRWRSRGTMFVLSFRLKTMTFRIPGCLKRVILLRHT